MRQVEISRTRVLTAQPARYIVVCGEFASRAAICIKSPYPFFSRRSLRQLHQHACASRTLWLGQRCGACGVAAARRARSEIESIARRADRRGAIRSARPVRQQGVLAADACKAWPLDVPTNLRLLRSPIWKKSGFTLSRPGHWNRRTVITGHSLPPSKDWPQA